MLSSEQDALYEIEEALGRIRQGNYGKCELTGKPIEVERLAAIPWPRFTTSSGKQLEQAGALKHARLGDRDTVAKQADAEAEGSGSS